MTSNKQLQAFLFSQTTMRETDITALYETFSGEQSHFKLLAVKGIKNSNLAFYDCSFVIEASVSDDKQSWRQELDSFCLQLQCDYCVFSDDIKLQQPRLVVFDMDSTLIPMEVIDELAAEAGVKNKVAEITEAAMRGEIDFNQSFEQRLSLLKGMSVDAVDAVHSRLVLNPGVKHFIEYLVSKGATAAIASGGFEPFAKRLLELTEISTFRANQLEFVDGQLTGRAIAPIVNATVKAETLTAWQKQKGLAQNETIAIGDGANDYAMLKSAGLGVAYKAKPYLRQRADCVLQFAEMDALADILESLLTPAQ